MRILVVGAGGTLGKAVVAELSARHEVISASRNAGVRIDLTDTNGIRTALQSAGRFDAIVSAAGNVHFAGLDQMNEELYAIGLRCARPRATG